MELNDDDDVTRTVTTTSTEPEAAPSEPDLPSGTLIGRYVVQEVLGRGGMGVVYRAHDPDLGRDVAIKLLRVRSKDTDAAAQRLRMLREAQALAKLSHPNIVAVHDVGTHEQAVFLAMEFVPGRTLGRWIHEENPPLGETLRVLIAAGRGLAAAHASGLVHRDVKPDNVFVGNDGRARIGDFGLARALGVATLEGEPLASGSPRTLEEGDGSASSNSGLLGHQVTVAGAVLGTPQYMAAEQFRGELADAATDQFSFCVTAFESLYGVRPFAARTMHAAAQRVLTGQLPTVPKQGRVNVPRRVLKILERGLERDAKARYPTLTALLDDLERDPLRALRRAAIGTALAVTTLGALSGWLGRGEAATPCGAGERMFASAWGEPQRSALQHSFVATGRPYALDTHARVATALDAYGKAWRDTRRQACEATRVHQEQSEALLDLRMTCLDERLERTRALIAVFSGSIDGAALDRAVESVRGLPPVTACSDAAALTSRDAPPTDPALRGRVEALRRELAHAYALEAAARYGEGLALAKRLTVKAKDSGQAALEAESELLLGALLGDAGEVRDAEQPLVRALAHAARARDVAREAEVALDLLYNVGYSQARHEHALGFLPFVEAAVLRSDDVRNEAQLASTEGLIRWSQGDYAAARARIERAVELGQKHAIEPGQQGHYLNNLGLVVNDSGDPAAALAVYDRALAIMESTLGPDHPNVAMVLNNRGNALNDLKRYDDARRDFARSLAVYEAALGPEHADLSYPLTNLGAIYSRLGRFDEARVQLERALSLDERYLGPEHTDIAFTLTSLADAYYGLGRHADARVLLERALKIRRSTEVPKVRLAETLFFLAKTVAAQRDARLSQRYLAEMDAALGDEQTAVAKDLRERRAAWAQGR